MPIHRSLLLLSLLTLVTRQSDAQGNKPTTGLDTLTLVSADPRHESHITLAGTGAHVVVLAGDRPLIADTMQITTPVRLVVPQGRFSLTVSSPKSDAGASLIMSPSRQTSDVKSRFQSKMYTPLTLTRSSEGAPLQVNTVRMESARVP